MQEEKEEKEGEMQALQDITFECSTLWKPHVTLQYKPTTAVQD